MEQKNEEQNKYLYPCNTVKYTGFGDVYELQIIEGIQSGVDQFKPSGKHIFDRIPVEAEIQVDRSSQGNYFPNFFKLKFEENGVVHEDSFKIDKGLKRVEKPYPFLKFGLVAKAAFQYMRGNSVALLRENQDKTVDIVWMLKDKDNQGKVVKREYGPEWFNLDQALNRRNFKEMQNPESKQDLYEGLMKGNTVPVTEITANGEYKRKIRVKVKYKEIENVGTAEMIIVGNGQRTGGGEAAKKQETEQSMAGESDKDSPSSKTSQKKDSPGEKETNTEKRKGKRSKVS